MKKRVLVVDDEMLIRDLLKHKLTAMGLEVETAQCAEEFLQKAPVFKPHLILLDIWLKNRRLGQDAYDELLNSGFDKRVPVIFITALVEGEPKVSPVNARNKYVIYSKPFDFEKLLPEVRRRLSEAEETFEDLRSGSSSKAAL